MTAAELARRLALVVITDPDAGEGRGVVEVVRRALLAGAPAVQLRAKRETGREMLALAETLRAETRAAGALLFVNDRVDVALAAGADGAHLGDDDLPLAAARGIVPPGFLLGRSVDTAEEARQAEREGADYVGFGPVHATPSKLDAAPPVGLGGVRAVAGATRLPVVAIGGIDERNVSAVAAAGADGVAVIRAVMRAAAPEAAVRALIEGVARGRRGTP